MSVTQVAEDLKARDAVLRSFPEVLSVVGKAGRAETATDPSPLDMIETIINLRDRDVWPKRKLLYADVERQTQAALASLEAKGLLKAAPPPIERAWSTMRPCRCRAGWTPRSATWPCSASTSSAPTSASGSSARRSTPSSIASTRRSVRRALEARRAERTASRRSHRRTATGSSSSPGSTT